MQRLHQPNTTDNRFRLSARPGRLATRRSPLSARRGFTLVELLMVILIIATLISLLVAAVSSAMTSARNAQVVAEIKSFEGALADFKAVFGKYPPSGITLYETGTDWDAAALAPQNARSKAKIRALWPQFNFGIDRDINQDGDSTDTHTIVGPECLVFFLGGMRSPDDTTVSPTASTTKAFIGFSKNPANPFAIAGTNRLGPFFEFEVNRLDNFVGAANNMLEYIDPLPSQAFPYIYLSSYDGSGYVNSEAHSSGLGQTGSPATGYYRQGTATGPGWKPKTFQIISPGRDGLPGSGGLFDPDKTSSLSTADEDNIANFHNGPLGG